MGKMMQHLIAEHGTLVLLQYVLMIPLVITAVLAGCRMVGNLARRL